ncbi:hypothetical protein PMF13cell1_01337 [Blautia producta]|uniref:ECF transporter S component n=1 Tax=Blautia producta TaxID=33035 RepID=A0A4P6LXF0_9FIRM|nr:hypothetical protein [Blautia producta]QBE95813.1 hypothetical protein PMF13cell1_01337 [Blautia producta]
MKTRSLVIMAMLTAILFLGQVCMAFLPNIEVVTLLVILYTQVYRKKVFFIIYAFALLEGVFYGFGLWWFNYLYVWSILALIVLLVRSESPLVWSMISGAYGLAFGFLCALPYFVSGGVGGGLAYWISGLHFDVLHCVGNVVVCLVLNKPLYYILKKLENSRQVSVHSSPQIH